MRRKDDVAVCRLAVHLVHAAAAASTHESPHATLIHDLKRLDEVGVEQEVQGGELLVGGGPRLGNGLQNVLAKRLNVACLHQAAIGGYRDRREDMCCTCSGRAAQRWQRCRSVGVSTERALKH